MTVRINQRYGWRRDLPDARDYRYVVPDSILTALPRKVDLRPKCPPIVNQSTLGSCTGNGIGGAYHFEELRQKLADAFPPSRLFIYYNERVMEGTVRSDAGAEIRDGIKSIAKQGVCSEVDWPYVISKFAVKPPQKCYQFALKHRAIKYARVAQNLDAMKGVLAQGLPFVFGFTVYKSFETASVTKTGIVPMPKPSESVLGGHCVVAVGYDDDKQMFICRNSWGTKWGDKGYFYMPYAYLTDGNLADDLWVIQLVTDDSTPSKRKHGKSNRTTKVAAARSTKRLAVRTKRSAPARRSSAAKRAA